MKFYTLLLTTSILFFFCSFASCQNLVKEGNQWNLFSPAMFCPTESTSLVKVYGDSLINDVTYAKLFSTQDTFGGNWRLMNVLIREDTTGKVFLREGNGEEILVFDFGLEVGDTFVRKNYGFACNLQVTEIDSVTLNNGEKRKRLKLGEAINSFTYTWIEGIGSEFGPTFREYCLFDVGSFLVCFSQNDELLYPESPDFCFRTTSVQSVLPSDVEIYPNPIHNTIRIEFSETIIQSYTLVNVMGQEILKGKLTGGSIDVSSVPVGTFVLLLRTRDGGVFSKKMIKLD